MVDQRRPSPAFFRRPATVTAGIGLAVFAVVVSLRLLGWLVSWELGAYDSFVRAGEAPEGESVVSMVWITEREIQRFGHPLEDRLMVRALEAVLEHGPRAVGVDVYRDRPTGEGWEDLERVFLAHPEVVIVEKLADSEMDAVRPPAFLPDRSQVGFADIMVDPDGVARRGLIMLWDEEGQHFLSLSLQLALRFLYAEGVTMQAAPERPDWVRLGPTTLPPLDSDFGGYRNQDAGGYQFVFDFRRTRDFPGVGFSELLDGEVDPALLHDKVVLIGTASPSVKDFFQIPSGWAWNEARINGAELHAQAVDQLVRFGRGQSAPLRAWSEPGETAWILLWCLGGATVGVRVRSAVGLVATTIGGLALLVWGSYEAFQSALWVPMVPGAAGWLGSLALAVTYVIQQERTDRRKMRGIFDKFMSPKLAESLWENREIFWHGDRPRPQRATATILLSDLMGYTTRTEKAEPADVMDWLGVYTDRMSHLVDEYGGMVHDFLGDGLMASFGLPFPREREEEIEADAVRAVECALAMGEALTELNETWASGEQPVRLRVGVLTGPVVVGAIGGVERMKYAAVGDTVNTAARLEAFDKAAFQDEHTTFRILVGQATLDRLGDRFETRCLGDHVLKGKGEKVTIHRVLGRRHEGPAPALGSGASR